MNEEVRKQQGLRIRELRESLGLNQEDFAALFGKRHQAVSKWELGKSSPASEDWFVMGQLAGTSLDYLFYNVRTAPVSGSPILDRIFSAPGVLPPPAASGTPARLPAS